MDATIAGDVALSDSPAEPRLAGAVAVVTGGGRGMGRVVAAALARAGAAVGLVARSAGPLEEAVALIESAGGTAAAAVADVSDQRAAAAALRRLARRVGPVDVLVNNAGISGPVAATWEIEPREWWRTVEVNLLGTVVCTRLVMPEMVGRGRGRIVNVTSQAGAFRWPTVSAYSVSKAAVIKLTENLAVEARRTGVSVFSVHPGLLPIGLSEQPRPEGIEDGSAAAQMRDWVQRELAEGRGADPERAAELMVRLAAGDADPLSGCHLSVHDDLDAMLAEAGRVRREDLYVLRSRGL